MFAFLRRARKPLSRFAAGAAMMVLAACDPGAFTMSGGSGRRIDAGAPVQVALLVPAGSVTDSDNALALSLENAARLAIEDLPGVRIDLRVYATAGQADQASIAARNAIADGAKIIVGPVFAQSANAAGVVAAAQNVNVLAFSNNPSIAGGNVFILGPTFQNTANRLVSYAVAQGKTSIAVVNGQSAAEQMGAAAIDVALRRYGANTATQQSFELSQQGIVDASGRIADALRASQAQAVFVTSGNDGALPYLAQLLPEKGAGPEALQWMGLQRWDVPASAVTLPGLQGGWFTVPDQGLSAGFAQRYMDAYGTLPLPAAGLAYDGIAAIGALIQTGDPEALTTSGLTRPSGFVGVNGVFRLLPDGTNERGLAIATIRNNQVIEIDPAPRHFYDLGY